MIGTDRKFSPCKIRPGQQYYPHYSVIFAVCYIAGALCFIKGAGPVTKGRFVSSLRFSRSIQPPYTLQASVTRVYFPVVVVKRVLAARPVSLEELS